MRVGVAAALIVVVAAFGAGAQVNEGWKGPVPESLSAEANAAFLEEFSKKPGVFVRQSGLRYRIVHQGFGKTPGPADLVTVEYTGKFVNGETFDGTEPGWPVEFQVNRVIAGWTEALLMMKEGDTWEIAIPADLAYGEKGHSGGIPPNQVLHFEVKLISTKPNIIRTYKDEEGQY